MSNLSIQEVITIVGDKELQLAAKYKDIKALEAKIRELENKIKELEKKDG